MGLGKEPGIAQQHLVRELVHLRSVAGLDQREIAKAVDLSQATVSRVERLGKLLSLPEVRAWAQAWTDSPHSPTLLGCRRSPCATS